MFLHKFQDTLQFKCMIWQQTSTYCTLVINYSANILKKTLNDILRSTSINLRSEMFIFIFTRLQINKKREKWSKKWNIVAYINEFSLTICVIQVPAKMQKSASRAEPYQQSQGKLLRYYLVKNA